MREYTKVFLLTDDEFNELETRLSGEGFSFNESHMCIDDVEYDHVGAGLYGDGHKTGHTRYIIPIDSRLTGVLGEYFAKKTSASDSPSKA